MLQVNEPRRLTIREPTPEVSYLSGVSREDFLWQTGSGEALSIGVMTDYHLFHTVRMIWNNRMPRDAQIVGPGEVPVPYRFLGVHSRTYHFKAIQAMVPELATRWANLTESQKYQLERMARYFVNRRMELIK